MRPVLTMAASGYLILGFVALTFSALAREGLKTRILADPCSYGARSVSEVLREDYPTPPQEKKERMIHLLGQVTEVPLLFQNCPPTHPLKTHVIALLEQTAASTLTLEEAEALMGVVFFRTSPEKMISSLLSPAAKKELIARHLPEFSAGLRDGRGTPQDPARNPRQSRSLRLTPSAQEMRQLLDENFTPPARAGREALLSLSLSTSRGLPKFTEWLEKGIEHADETTLKNLVRTMIQVLKRVGFSSQDMAKAMVEVRPTILAELTRTREQADSALPLILHRYPKEMEEETLLARVLEELQGEPRLRLIRTFLVRGFDGPFIYGGGDVIGGTLAQGVDVSVPLYEAFLQGLQRWNGSGDPFETVMNYTIAHPSTHASFEKFLWSGKVQTSRFESYFARIKLPPDDPSWGFVEKMVFQSLDRQSQGAWVRDYLKLLDLSSQESRRHLVDLMVAKRVNTYPQPSNAYRIARPEDLSNLYSLLIGRMLEMADQNPDWYLKDTPYMPYVTVPADRAYLAEVLQKTHPTMAGKYPKLRDGSPPPPAPAVAPPMPPDPIRAKRTLPQPPPAGAAPADLRERCMTFKEKPSPALLQDILLKSSPGPGLRELLALVVPVVESPTLDDQTRRTYVDLVATPNTLMWGAGLDQIRLARLASPEARKASLRLRDAQAIQDLVALPADQSDLFRTAVELLLQVPASFDAVPAPACVPLLSDRRVEAAPFDQLLERLITKEPVDGTALDRIAEARAIEGRGPGLFFKRYLGTETDFRKRLAKMGRALGPVRELRGGSTPLKGPDDELFLAILEDLRKGAASFRDPIDERVRLEGLTSYVRRNRLSAAVQGSLIDTYKAVPTTLPALRLDLYRAIASFGDSRAITFVIEHLPEHQDAWKRLSNRPEPFDAIVVDSVFKVTRLSLLQVPISAAEEWLKKNKTQLKNQYAP
jgi:hypothetical protein